jgi:hypothetical protein
MAGIYSQGGSAGHRYAGWLSKVEAKNFQFGGKVFNGSPSAIYVGSKMVWANCLTKATKQAIMAAFGVDGTAVIAATNEYLNGIAASDKAKATALAGFINEDPMMVCSLGLEPQGVTMPVRWLNITGDASLLTGITLAGNSEIRWKWKYDDNGLVQIGHRAGGSGSNGVVIDTGTLVSNNVRTYMIPGGSQWATAFSGLSKGVAYEMRYDITNGKLYKDNSSSNLSANATALTVGQLSIESAMNGSVSYIEGDNNRIYPYIKNGICGMLDIETGTFHQQTSGSGSFTIEYTLPDGTPWTPPTP